MTQEEKQLLLKDLCARLPYKVKVKSSRRTIVTTLTLDIINDFYLGCDIKPYLRPISSMTDEEWNNYKSTWKLVEHDLEDTYEPSIESFDWLIAHNFDCRGLIPMGLALEAPKDMYKTE